MLLKIVTVINKVPLMLNIQLIRACGVVTGKKIEIKGSLLSTLTCFGLHCGLFLVYTN